MVSSKGSLNVAVLLTFEAQLLDLAGVDLFGMLDKQYIAAAFPQSMVNIALDVKIYYIGRDGTEQGDAQQGLRALTAQASIKADVSVTSALVRPGAIDILMIPGPPPTTKQTEQTLEYVRAHSDYGTTILTICTGCSVAAQAGILDGLRASGFRALIPQLRKDFPNVIWDDSRRLVKDIKKIEGGRQQELWSSGGITNGLEMIAAFIKDKWPGPLSQAVCGMADVADRGEYYDSEVNAADM